MHRTALLVMRFLAVAAVLAAGCSRAPEAAVSRRANDTPHRGQEAVQHIVLCWLKSPGDAMARAQLIGTSLGFKDLPGVIDVTAGPPVPFDRAEVDDSFDVAIVMTFRDEAALRAYERHPAHKAAVQSVLRPLVERVVIYDAKAGP